MVTQLYMVTQLQQQFAQCIIEVCSSGLLQLLVLYDIYSDFIVLVHGSQNVARLVMYNNYYSCNLS